MNGTIRGLALGVLALALTLNIGFAQEPNAGLREKALALNTVTGGDDAMFAKVRELRKDKDELKKLVTEARAHVKEKDKESPYNYTGNFILALGAQSVKEYDSSEFFFKACIELAFKQHSTKKKAQVYKGLILLFEQQKKHDDAIFACQKFIDLKDDNGQEVPTILDEKPFMIDQMLQIMGRKKDFDKALKLVDQWIDRADESALGIVYRYRKADLLREATKFEEAVKQFEEVIEKSRDNEQLTDVGKERYVNGAKYSLSSIYVDLKQVEKSIKVLEELIAEKPDNSSFLNDLGYVLADNDMRLDEAEKYVEKALEIDRSERKKLRDKGDLLPEEDIDHGAYVDSLAWVHFKKKNYAKALELMKEVVKQDGSQHVEIYDHLAQIHLALGDKAEALKAWEKALTVENISHRDDDRKAAVKKKLDANK